ncbi:LexA family transcriptional regulator [Lactiplantibacillus plantarum]|nr:LexA family transcriptional regulator [Lactiplantibacillus plantarum]MCG0617732.1 LexA family transcriptional regulator [Lactiplantibacillus plantarum]MCG0779945.1 LexA family transcriptional regulator [Lactiplantibacillus plantarum]MCG0806165.1 LexA family transcriptional regulator [Lactiplantibacillus plantarum]MCG0831044.1 LexA family transcriptional regulator [Lactiplantibacillus plantarum]
MFSTNLKYLRKLHGLDQQSFAKKINRSVSTVSEWESGKYTPKAGILADIANMFNVKLDDMMSKDLSIIKEDIFDNTISVMKLLNPDRQQNVYNYADSQLKEQNGKVVNLPLVGKSAANPTELTYGDVEIEHDDFTDVPHGADTAIRIQGDSMEPLIHDGQIIFYHQQEEVENGEIAIVEIDGDGVTCKQIYYDYTSNEVILRSINKKYEPRHVKDDQVRIIGRVIL